MNVRPVSDKMTGAMIDVFNQPMTEEEHRHSAVVEHVPAKAKPKKICRYSHEGLAALAPNGVYNRQGIFIKEYIGKSGTPLCKVKWDGCKNEITYPRRHIEIIQTGPETRDAPARSLGVRIPKAPPIESATLAGIARVADRQAARGQGVPSAAVGVELSKGDSASQPARFPTLREHIVTQARAGNREAIETLVRCAPIDKLEDIIFDRLWSTLHPGGDSKKE